MSMTTAVLAVRNPHRVSCVCSTAENRESNFCRGEGEQQLRLNSQDSLFIGGGSTNVPLVVWLTYVASISYTTNIEIEKLNIKKEDWSITSHDIKGQDNQLTL